MGEDDAFYAECPICKAFPLQVEERVIAYFINTSSTSVEASKVPVMGYIVKCPACGVEGTPMSTKKAAIEVWVVMAKMLYEQRRMHEDDGYG